MIVMKFGGTSVGSKEAIERTVGIVRGRLGERPVVVVSAMSKVTDMLYAISDAVEAAGAATPGRAKAAAREAVEALRAKHTAVIEELMPADPLWRAEALSRVNSIIDAIDPSDKAALASTGEYLSSNIIACYMNSIGIRTTWIDAREFMITDEDTMKGVPDMAEIERRAPKVIDAAYAASDTVITQGFVGATRGGVKTVLGRGGSDYSASLIGMAMDASRIEIWTDVDGVRSADPRKVDNTLCISRISFEEAAEMAAYGAKVLHPKTIEPAVMKNIPVMVLNSMNPGGEGTTILPNALIEDGVKSVSSKEKIAVINMTRPVLSDASRLLTETFAVLQAGRVDVDLVSVRPEGISLTSGSLDRIPAAVEKLRMLGDVTLEQDKAQISVIGKNISELKVALRNASDLLRGSSIVSVTQSDSFVNISFVVPRDLSEEAVRQIHSYLFEK